MGVSLQRFRPFAAIPHLPFPLLLGFSLILTITGLLIASPPQARAADITYVRFDWSTANNGSIVAVYCIAANYHWLTGEEISPNPHYLGRYDFGAINGCESRYIALGVLVGDVIEVGIGASDTQPNGGLGGTRFYRVTRNSSGLTWYLHRTVDPTPTATPTTPPQPTTPPAPTKNPLITYVRFDWSTNHNGSIVAVYCIAANYRWLTGEEIAPNPHYLGRYDFGAINGCESRYIALGVLVGDVIEVGVGASNTPPNGGLTGTDFYRVTRTNSGLSSVYHRSDTSPHQNTPTPTPPPGDTPSGPITYVRFDWSSNYNGSILAVYCINASYRWLTSEELSPTPKYLGRWDYGAINGCESRYTATGVQVGDVILVGIGASNTQPNGNLSGTRYYRVTRTNSGLSWVFDHTDNSSLPPAPELPTPTPPPTNDTPGGLITSVRFEYSSAYNGSVVAVYCLNTPYYWLTSEELSPNPKYLGRWDYGTLNGCESRNVAIGTQVGNVIQIGIGASTTPPNGGLGNTRYYRVTRTNNGISWSFDHVANPGTSPGTPTPPAGEVCAEPDSWNIHRRVPIGPGSITSDIVKKTLYEGMNIWPEVLIRNTTGANQNVDVTFELSWSSGTKRITVPGTAVGSSTTFFSRFVASEQDAVSTEGWVKWVNNRPSGTLRGRITTNKCSRSVDFEIPVEPRPVVLVHGWRTNQGTWDTFKGYLNELRISSFAVDTMRTGGPPAGMRDRTNTIGGNAEQLRQYIRGKQQEYGFASFDIVAHSMGGLISRYYIDSMMTTSPRPVRQLIMLATPNGGSDAAYPYAAWGFYNPASTELLPPYLKSFNQLNTRRYGVTFRGIACRIPPTYMDDVVVTVDSVRAIPLDSFVTYRRTTYDCHTLMPKDRGVFDTYIKGYLTGQPQNIAATEDESVPGVEIRDPNIQDLVMYADPAGVTQAGTHEHTITIDGQSAVTFDFYTEGKDGDIKLRDPSGAIIDVSSNGRISIDNPLAPDYSYLAIQPFAGEWTAIISGSTANVTIFVHNTPEAGDVLLRSTPHVETTSASALVTAVLEGNGVITNVNAQALVVAPSGHQQHVSVKSLGNSKYEAQILMSEPGLYSVFITTTGERDGAPFTRVSTTTVQHISYRITLPLITK